MRVIAAMMIVLVFGSAQAQEATGAQGVPLPLPRPADIGGAVEMVPQPPEEGEPGDKVETEPQRIYQVACPALLAGDVEATVLAPIREGMCGLRSPLSVTAVMLSGRRVALSQPATLNCAMAGELAKWTKRLNTYSEAVFNSGIEELLTGTSYVCRPRNNVSGTYVSEHGFGNAIDVTGFSLESGDRIILPDNWGDDGEKAGAMEMAHDAACGYFTTVLGPEANALHADHLHLDLGCHGRTCTARLCE